MPHVLLNDSKVSKLDKPRVFNNVVYGYEENAQVQQLYTGKEVSSIFTQLTNQKNQIEKELSEEQKKEKKKTLKQIDALLKRWEPVHQAMKEDETVNKEQSEEQRKKSIQNTNDAMLQSILDRLSQRDDFWEKLGTVFEKRGLVWNERQKSKD